MTNAEIQVGEYVRTIDGYIRKVIQYNEKGSYDCLCWGAYFVDKDYKHCKGISAKKIKSHSFNLIDLIETGDYVKLYEKLGNKEYIDEASSYVSNTGTIDGKRFIELDYGQDGTEYFYDTNKIKTIVTHEQFKAMEYKVGGEND